MPLINFNASDHTPTDPNKTGFEPLKPGWYIMEIIESAIRDTKAGDGEYIAFTFKGTEGEARNRQVWCNINRINPSEQCMAIGRRQLGDLCHAVGVINPERTEDLHGRPFGVKLKIEEWEGKKKNVAIGFCSKANIPAPEKKTTDEVTPAPTGNNVFA